MMNARYHCPDLHAYGLHCDLHPQGGLDPLIHSARWVQEYPFLSRLEAEIWRDDFDPMIWVKSRNTPDRRSEPRP